ncbi:MAG TPA: hypothetical protein VFK33_11005 [Bacillales bacterium]|nr:hypothetical protein [Bacillales bacterium]
MTKRGMRAFAAGLWVAAAVLACFFYFGPQTQETAAKPSEVTKGQVQRYLANHNQIAIDESKYEAQQSTTGKKDKPSKKETSNKTDNAKKDNQKSGKSNPNKKESSPKSYTLHIHSGMTGGEIGQKLENADIISNWYDLSKYLQNHNLENKVQLGTFTITGDMSVSEIAKKITS